MLESEVTMQIPLTDEVVVRSDMLGTSVHAVVLDKCDSRLVVSKELE